MATWLKPGQALAAATGSTMICFPRLRLKATRDPQTWQIRAPLSATLWISANSQKPISRKRWQTAGWVFKSRTRSLLPTLASQRSTKGRSAFNAFGFTDRNQHQLRLSFNSNFRNPRRITDSRRSTASLPASRFAEFVLSRPGKRLSLRVGGFLQARISPRTRPCTSVRRRSIPL